MKVLHVYRTCYPETKGGVEQVIRYITKGCQGSGVESKILALSDTENKKFIHENTEVILTKKIFELASNSFSLGMFIEFYKLSNWADIIHYHYPWPSGDLLSILNYSKPTVITYHSDIIKQKFLKRIYFPLEQFFLSKASVIVATSPQYAASSKTLIKFNKKVEVIPLAIDPEDYKHTNDALDTEMKNRYGTNFFYLLVY
ncbi:glycosyltransferase [Vibrio algarum]|uniref:Glycosyltransferase n=1 Tax=Vibrio algarum TaxID=3020714 RepID=A0ABT4YLU9_9VIBR|nr:glycosyltransferase [Vibrio sp. KJ40-1]MDB1122410.1 glycosyltransferase [Vibrio sp. KJ40-1]